MLASLAVLGADSLVIGESAIGAHIDSSAINVGVFDPAGGSGFKMRPANRTVPLEGSLGGLL